MKKFRIEREIVRSQIQIVEAENEDDALEIAQENEDAFEDTINNDDEWNYLSPVEL